VIDLKNVSLKKYNTYKLNCTAKEFYIPNDKEELLQILKYIKEKFRKKNIIINGDVDIESIRKIKGVNEVEENALDIIVRIDNQDVAPKVFKEVSKCKNVTKFIVEDASLNEIFLSTVGENYEK